MRYRALLVALTLTALLAACGGDGTSSTAVTYEPAVDPSQFSTTIDNPYLPLHPGTRWVYEGTTEQGLERTVVEVTPETRVVMGVETVVVSDVVSIGGEQIESTRDWYAQDGAGNVWYFGEDTKEYEGGEVVSTEGSWEAGVDGAQPGIVMMATPAVGDAYRQEYLAGEAEDMAEVLAIGETVAIQLGTFESVVVTKDWTPLEPEVVEHKHFAPGVGLVLEEQTAGGSDHVELRETNAR